MARITPFEVGYCRHPACVALKGAGFRACRFPARAYLIEAGNRGGTWIWDTGYASHFTTSTARGIYRLYARVTPVYLQEEDALIYQLSQSGVRISDIRGLLISHFHGDHIAGLRDFKGVPCFSGEEGWNYYKNLRGFRAVRKGFVPDLIPEDFEDRLHFVEHLECRCLPAELSPFETGWVLPGSDDEVFIVSLPGHAKGQIGAFVHTMHGWALLAADAAWAPESYRDLREPAWIARTVMDDYAEMLRTLHKLHRLHLHGRVRILLAHEGGMPSEMRPLRKGLL